MTDSPKPIAVVDGTVVWHVHTDLTIDVPLTGAWDHGPLEDLTAGAVVVHPHDNVLDSIAASMASAVEEYQEVFGAPLPFPAVQVPDTAAYTFTGDPQVERAWRLAQGIVELRAVWEEIERVRRRRKALKEKFGAAALPLPLGSWHGAH